MKKLILTAFILLFQFIHAQEITSNLGDFTSVRVFDRISVQLVASSENKIVITGGKANDVEIVLRNKELKIRMKFSKLLKGEDINATLYYNGMIDKIEASEGSYVSSQDNFKNTSFDLNAKEGAAIKLNLDVEKLKSRINSGGEIELSGKATNHSVNITSGGILKARNFITSQTSITVSAGGNADVNAAEFVEARVRAGGTVDIFGNPKKIDKKTVAGGTINERP